MKERRVLVRHQGCLWHVADGWDTYGMMVSPCGEVFRTGNWDHTRYSEERDLHSPAKALICSTCFEVLEAEAVASALMRKGD